MLRQTPNSRLTRPIFALGVLIVLVLSACSSSNISGDSEEASVSFAEATTDGFTETTEAFETAGVDGEFDSPSTTTMAAENADAARDETQQLNPIGVQQPAQPAGRQIIFTAQLVVEVDDVEGAARQAVAAVNSRGGFMFGEETVGGSQPYSTLILKVPPSAFDNTIDDLHSIGELVSQSISADDVTERIVDLESRIEVAELGVERLKEALINATSLEDYAELEALLLDRESELEVMRGSLRTLETQVDFATITLTLTQEGVNRAIALNASVYHASDDGVSCPGADDWSVESGTEVTLCLEVINTGDEPLSDLALIDTGLGIDSINDLTLVYGSIDLLEPSQSTMLAYEFEADRTVRLRTKVTARPAENEGPTAPSVDATFQQPIQVFEPESEPGFFDGFSAGVNVLQRIWAVIVPTAGFLIPMLVFVALLWPVWRWLKPRLRTWREARRRANAPRMQPIAVQTNPVFTPGYNPYPPSRTTSSTPQTTAASVAPVAVDAHSADIDPHGIDPAAVDNVETDAEELEAETELDNAIGDGSDVAPDEPNGSASEESDKD